MFSFFGLALVLALDQLACNILAELFTRIYGDPPPPDAPVTFFRVLRFVVVLPIVVFVSLRM